MRNLSPKTRKNWTFSDPPNLKVIAYLFSPALQLAAGGIKFFNIIFVTDCDKYYVKKSRSPSSKSAFETDSVYFPLVSYWSSVSP